MKTIGQIKEVIKNRLHGTTLNKLGDFYTLCRDASEIMVNRIDLQEARRSALLPNAVYDQVYDYQLPSDFKAPVDLRPQSSDNIFRNNGSLSRTYSRQFANNKVNNSFAVLYRDTLQFMRFARYINAPAIVDRTDSISSNGTWTVGGNASNLELDTFNYVSGGGSLKCDVSSPGAVQNVIMQIGEDISNYYEKTVTMGHFEPFKNDWNLLRFSLFDANLTGTVDMTSIKYIKFTVTYNSGQVASYSKTFTEGINLSDRYKTNGAIFTYMYFNSITALSSLRLDNITANLGTVYNLDYYSNLMFRTNQGVWIDQPTSDSDILNCSTASYKIFEAELSKLICQQVQGALGMYDDMYWTDMLDGLDGNDRKEGLYSQYERMYPSERIEAQTDYYNFTDDFDINNQGIDNLPISYFN
jgi:hypothetical protein